MSRQKGRLLRIGAAAGIGLAWAAAPVSAHHSTALQFDMTKEIVVEGTIVEMEWRNPHAWLQIEVENDAGEPEIWRLEFGSANSLYRRGWRRDDLPIGAKVRVHGLPARDGSRTLAAEEVTLPDGRELFAGPREPR
jgi:hypothetical protein